MLEPVDGPYAGTDPLCICTLALKALRKAKAQLKLSLARGVKSNKKGFCKFTGDKRKTRESVGPLVNEAQDLVKEDLEKAGVLKAFFVLVFTSKTDLQESQMSESKGQI